ncbi:multidrug ABC transporter permease/ATP-binding protein, partial [Streptococcus danieliae]|nr:multidrug ABC transporter permease/ATP-binding protein [Streptococcus danieliae]
VTLITMFFMISWKLTLLVIIPLPLLAFATNRIGKKIHDAFKQSQASFSDLNNNVQEAVTGMKVTKSFVYGQDEIEKFNINNDYNYMRNIKTMKY